MQSVRNPEAAEWHMFLFAMLLACRIKPNIYISKKDVDSPIATLTLMGSLSGFILVVRERMGFWLQTLRGCLYRLERGEEISCTIGSKKLMRTHNIHRMF